MDKVDRIIEKVRQLREDGMVAGGNAGMTTQSSKGVAGFSSKAVDPVAGLEGSILSEVTPLRSGKV